MNGKDMLEAMGYVEESYVQAAASPSRHRRRYWPGAIAAAACAALVVGLAAFWRNSQEELLLSARSTDSAAYSDAEELEEAALGGALTSGSTAPLEMTVRVLEQAGETLRCVVEDPGTGGYAVGQEITVVLGTTSSSLSRASTDEVAPFSEDGESETTAQGTLWIQYTPGEDDTTVIAITCSPVAEEATEG